MPQKLTTCVSVGWHLNFQRNGSPERVPLRVSTIPPPGVGEEEREEEGGRVSRWEDRLARRTGSGASTLGFKDWCAVECVQLNVCVCVGGCQIEVK